MGFVQYKPQGKGRLKKSREIRLDFKDRCDSDGRRRAGRSLQGRHRDRVRQGPTGVSAGVAGLVGFLLLGQQLTEHCSVSLR